MKKARTVRFTCWPLSNATWLDRGFFASRPFRRGLTALLRALREQRPRHRHQVLSRHQQARRREQRAHLRHAFRETAGVRFREAALPLDHADRTLALGPYTCRYLPNPFPHTRRSCICHGVSVMTLDCDLPRRLPAFAPLVGSTVAGVRAHRDAPATLQVVHRQHRLPRIRIMPAAIARMALLDPALPRLPRNPLIHFFGRRRPTAPPALGGAQCIIKAHLAHYLPSLAPVPRWDQDHDDHLRPS